MAAAPEKRTRTKKTVPKKATSTGAKKAAGRKSAKKVPASTRRKATTKAVKKSALPKTKSAPKRSAVRLKSTDPTVVLPPRMSMRAQEKTLVLAEMFERDFFETGVLLSRVAGICLVLVGGLLAVTTLFHASSEVCPGGCAAQLIGSTDLLQVGTAVPATTNQTVLALGTLPSVITDTVTLPLQVSNATDVSASLNFDRPNGSRGVILLDVANLGNEKYSVEIRGGVLQPGTYDLKVEVQFLGTQRYQTFTLGSFVVPTQTTTQTAASSTPSLLGTNATSTTQTPVTEIVSDQTIQADQLAPTTDSTFRLFAPREVSGIAQVTLTTTNNFSEVEFFVRPVNGINSQRVGSITAGQTLFKLNSFNLPNGSYELFAKGLRPNGSVTSEAVPIRIFNRETISTFDATADQERELLTISRALNQDLYDSFEGGEPVDQTVRNLADERLAADADTIDTLFEAYAVAQQSGDQALIAVAEQAIADYRKAIISNALLDENDRYIADELDEVLNARLEEFKDRVQQFEALRRERTENDSSIDTDLDGVSDVDEVVLYKTDPNRADTDGDGFTDGAEIIRGYNPLSEEPEAAIVYESPKETIAVIKTDKLVVEEVVPDIVLETESTGEVVQTVVRGKALPNSYVTLYVFSTPTIVTVRTDETGAFEYVFTKELEDGEHQVFAALTDNSGAIIAQSEPFTFVKEARAFTPVDAAAEADLAPIAYVDTGSSDNSYRVVIGMAVLALGILLILLGLGLRSNKPEEIVVTQD